MSIIKYQKTKTTKCKDNTRSSNCVSANLIMGCSLHNSDVYSSPCQFCYVARFGRKYVYINTNTDEILNEVDKWVQTKSLVKIPDQVHKTLYMCDIGVDVDVNYYFKHYNWFYVFDWFKNHPRLGATFATKWVNTKLLEYEPNQKIRVRMSLMPENIRQKVEQGTSPIINRIKFLNDLVKAGYEAHINFSPIIYYDGWLQDYELLFQDVVKFTNDEFKHQYSGEFIFLTHNSHLNKINLERDLDESLLWNPDIQEEKISEYGGNNVRYKWQMKEKMIQQFKELYSKYFDLNTIRYIF